MTYVLTRKYPLRRYFLVPPGRQKMITSSVSMSIIFYYEGQKKRSKYSPVPTKHAGANKHAWWKIPVNLINMQGLINMYSGSFYQDTRKNCIGK